VKYIDQFYTEKISRGEMPGVVLLIARHGKIAHLSALGYANVETHQKMTTDAIFRLYSMTKPVAAVALMILYEEGRFQLEEPVTKYLPEFAYFHVLRNPNGPINDTVPMQHPPTMHDILRHTAGFADELPALQRQYDDLEVPLADLMPALTRMPLRYQPGTTWSYSFASDVQARLVEVLSGLTFDAFLEQRLFRPLGMRDTDFWVPPGKAQRLVSVSETKEGKLVPFHAKDHVNCRSACAVVDSYTANHKRKGGDYGLVGTAEDYWRFAQMMANRGELNGVRLLSPQTAEYIARDHLGSIPIEADAPPVWRQAWGLGFAVMKDPVAHDEVTSEGTYFWHGAAGTTFWIDPKRDLVVVALVQQFGIPAMDTFWPEIRTLVYT
jgi:CubicO group peptidase (beta-lactamase class C family)